MYVFRNEEERKKSVELGWVYMNLKSSGVQRKAFHSCYINAQARYFIHSVNKLQNKYTSTAVNECSMLSEKGKFIPAFGFFIHILHSYAQITPIKFVSSLTRTSLNQNIYLQLPKARSNNSMLHLCIVFSIEVNCYVFSRHTSNQCVHRKEREFYGQQAVVNSLRKGSTKFNVCI